MSLIIDYNSILNSLDFLNRKQLEKIKSIASYKLQSKQGGQSLEEEDWLLRGILVELKRRGIVDKIDSFRIKNDRAFAGFSTKSELVRKLLEDAAPDLTLLEKRLLGEVCGYELSQYITWVDVTLKTMLDYIHYVPNAIEKSFPGYLSSKMLNVIIQHRFS